MSRIWQWTVAFGKFWYGFIIGDDWVGAAGVLVLIGGTWGLVRAGAPAIWFGPVAIIATAVLLVWRGAQREPPA